MNVGDTKRRESDPRVTHHYARLHLIERIRDGLTRAGLDTERLRPRDLKSIDQFHLGGIASAEKLLDHATPRNEDLALDLGSGLGGPARQLAQAGCRVIGIDFTPEYCAAARQLSEWVGLSNRTQFLHGDACRLPLRSASMQVVWMQHLNMNVRDKRRLIFEVDRVLAPGGVLVIHEVFSGPDGPAILPVPWASDPRCSFLLTQAEFRERLQESGLVVEWWDDVTEESLAWAGRARDRIRSSASDAPLGLHLALGNGFSEMLSNLCRNLAEQRLTVAMARARKS